MADTELERTGFTLECAVDIKFDASDITANLTPLETLDLIEEVDEELDSWEATILLARSFHRRSKEAPTELIQMTDEQLEALLDKEAE